MMTMALFAILLAVILPGQLINVFIGVFTLYHVGTARLTVRRRPGAAGFVEKIAMMAGLCLFAPFVILSFDLAFGLAPIPAGRVADLLDDPGSGNGPDAAHCLGPASIPADGPTGVASLC
jgi:hypothetical protein